MMIVLALLIGIVAGLRAMTAPAALAWASLAHPLIPEGSWLAWMGYRWTPWIFTLLAIGELVSDQLPNTPSRKSPVQFVTRLLSGGLCGGVLGAASGALAIGIVLGVIGAAIGTLAGAGARARLAAFFGADRPAALLEDAVAIIGALLIAIVA